MEEEEEMLQPKLLPDQPIPIIQMQPQGQPSNQSPLDIQNFNEEETARIETAFTDARNMASIAIRYLNKEMGDALSVRQTKHLALVNTFGQATQDILDRYVSIKNSALVTNEVRPSPSCASNDEEYHFARGEIGNNKIFICPDFHLSVCDHASTILHEAAHNAGAIHGSNPIDEAWNYENYARLLQGKQMVGPSGVEEEVGAVLGDKEF